jgi:hypothetical protein
MKTRILIIALALVFVSGLAVAAPFKGVVPVPFSVSAEHDGTTIQAEWEACTSADCATKFSVVFYTTFTYYMDALDEACVACTDGEVEVELDYGTADELEGLVFTDLGEGHYMLEIDKAIVDADFDAAFEAAMGECFECVDDYDNGTVYVKIKGLDPGKLKGRQNNEFSEPVELMDATPGE